MNEFGMFCLVLKFALFIDEIQELIENHTLDDRLQQLPLIATDALKTHNELRLAHLLLTTLAAAHVWQDGPDKVMMISLFSVQYFAVFSKC